MDQFYFLLTNQEAHPLVRDEIKIRFPQLRPSYSRPGFLTFKGPANIDFCPLFSRVSGVCHGVFKKSDLRFHKAWVYALSEDLSLPFDLRELSENSLFRIGETVTLVIMVGEDEYWVGTYKLESHHFQTPGEVSSILPVEEVPSRAYYKIAQVYEAFDLPMENQEVVLELGSAPGGASHFLLEQDLRVIGVDPAQMNEKILKHFDFKHLKRPFEGLGVHEIKEDIDWIVGDINLPPSVVIKEVFHLLTFLSPRGIILNLKINNLKSFLFLADVREKFRKKGFKKVHFKYLPSHRREIALIALDS